MRWPRCKLQIGVLSDNANEDIIVRLLSTVWLRPHPKMLEPCWIRGNDQSIYTSIDYNGKREAAHRVSYEIFTGKKLLNCGCHHCDVPACINPNHIFDGTNRQNHWDSTRKGRSFGISLNNDFRVSKSEKKLNDSYKNKKLLITHDFKTIGDRLKSLVGDI